MPAQEEALVGALAPVIKGAIAQATAPLIERIAQIESQLEAMPAPEKGERGESGERGEDGADADMVAIERQINARFDELVKAIPAAKDGKDGRDGVGIVELLQNKQGELIAVMTDGTSKNIGVIQGKDGKDGKPGENANIEAIREIVAGMSQEEAFDPEAVKALIPEPIKGVDGEKGEPGESAYQIAVRLGFKGSEREWIESLKGEAGQPGEDGKDGPQGEQGPAGEKGDPGKDGAPGEKGEKGDQGERGVDIEDIFFNNKKELIIRQSNDIDFNLGDLRGEKGEKGEPGERGEKGDPGVAGKDGADGKDGRGIEAAHQNEKGELVVRFTDGAEKNVGVVRGEKGDPGASGKDGLGFDDVRLEYDGERTVDFVFERGDDRKKSTLVFPNVIHRGQFQQGTVYKRGDCVMYGGASWVAQRDTEEKPNHHEDAGWALAARKGRDGKDGKPGDRGPEGKAGRPGRDLTQIDPSTGRKW